MSLVNIETKWYFILAVVALMIVILKQCDSINQIKSDYAQLGSYKPDTVHYDTAKDGSIIAYNERLELNRIKSLEAFRADLLAEVKNQRLKKVENITVIRDSIVIRGIDIPFDTPIPFLFDEPFDWQNPYVGITGRSTNNGVFIDQIALADTVTLISGVKKNGLFKANQTVLTLNRTNPYIYSQGIESYSFPKKRNWKWRLLEDAAFLTAGYWLHGKLNPNP